MKLRYAGTYKKGTCGLTDGEHYTGRAGWETGSQAVLLAGASGATTPQSGSLMLLTYALGLVVSNSLIALFSLAGLVSSSTKRTVYVVVGVLAGVFSLVVGALFLLGRGADLPDLQSVLNAIFGELN